MSATANSAFREPVGAKLDLLAWRCRLPAVAPANDGARRRDVPERIALFDYTPFTGRPGPDYDVAANGSRFLMIRSSRETPSTRVQVVLVQNWIRELSEKVR